MANPRTFALSVLLRLRRQREDKARQSLVAAQRDADATQSWISMLRQTLSDQSAAARAAVLGRELPGDSPITQRRYWRPLATELYRQLVVDIRKDLAGRRKYLAAAKDVVAGRRKELAAAMKQRRVLSRLKERLLTGQAEAARRQASRESEESHAARAAAGADLGPVPGEIPLQPGQAGQP